MMVPVCIPPAVPESANAWLVLPDYGVLSMSGYWCEAGSWCPCGLVVAHCAGVLVRMMHTTSRCTAVASAPVTNDTVDLLLQSRFSKGYSCSCCRSRDNAFVSNYAPLLSQSGLPCSHCTRAGGEFCLVRSQ